MRSALEHSSVGKILGKSDADYNLSFRRSEALPPDPVSLSLGTSAGNSIIYQRIAEQLYGYGDPERPARVLDLGTGIGTFLIGVMTSGNCVPTELVGIDKNEQSLQYAKYNLGRAIVKNNNYSSNLLIADWNDDQLWQQLGQFDVIFLNPPYLLEGVNVLPGYEQTPTDLIYTDDRAKDYRNLFTKSLERLVLGGRLIYRLPGKSGGEFSFRPTESEMPSVLGQQIGAITLIETWQPHYDRTARFSDYSLLTDAQQLPPWADPRVLVYAQSSIDINTELIK